MRLSNLFFVVSLCLICYVSAQTCPLQDRARAEFPEAISFPRPDRKQLPVGVEYYGSVENGNSWKAIAQRRTMEFGSAWTTCDVELMDSILAPNVLFAYPSNTYYDKEGAMDDFIGFCDANPANVSVMFAKDSFAITKLDSKKTSVYVQVRFRETKCNYRSVVDDIWYLEIENDKITVIKEFLDGRVKYGQEDGILTNDETTELFLPWPPRSVHGDCAWPDKSSWSWSTNDCGECPFYSS